MSRRCRPGLNATGSSSSSSGGSSGAGGCGCVPRGSMPSECPDIAADGLIEDFEGSDVEVLATLNTPGFPTEPEEATFYTDQGYRVWISQFGSSVSEELPVITQAEIIEDGDHTEFPGGWSSVEGRGLLAWCRHDSEEGTQQFFQGVIEVEGFECNDTIYAGRVTEGQDITFSYDYKRSGLFDGGISWTAGIYIYDASHSLIAADDIDTIVSGGTSEGSDSWSIEVPAGGVFVRARVWWGEEIGAFKVYFDNLEFTIS